MLTYSECLILHALEEPSKTCQISKKINNYVSLSCIRSALKRFAKNEWVKIYTYPYGKYGQPRVYYIFERTSDGKMILEDTLAAYKNLMNGAMQ